MNILAHEYAELFPMMSAVDYAALLDGMRKTGYDKTAPIVLYQEKVLDGRNRLKAALELGIDPPIIQYDGDDPLAFVIRHNLNRRHLNESQRAVVAGRLANMTREDAGRMGAESAHGLATANLQLPKVTQAAAAAMLNVSPRTVATVKAIEKAAPELVAKIESGEMSAHEASREVKRRQLPDKIAELPKDKYRVFYADPPWKYGNSGLDDYGHAERHYPTLSISDLCAMPVKEMAQPDAVLFLWVTSPLLEECFPVIRAWGFEYKTSFVWDKVKHNMGHYNSVRHEFLLVCTRGQCTPEVKKLFDSVYSEERTEHSAKPDFFRNVIDTIYPGGRRIELFARVARDGWERWGNE